MTDQTSRPVLNVRALPSSREVVAYKDGGLFPLVVQARDGLIVALLRGGAGHLGIEGRLEVIRSTDGGHTWSPPAVVADSARDDRDPAFGISNAGTLVVSYMSDGSYDAAGNYRPVRNGPDVYAPIEVMITRSHDNGLTWEKPYPRGVAPLRANSHFGKIVALPDDTLLVPTYCAPRPEILGERMNEARPEGTCSYLARSRDDGRTWGEPSLLAVNKNETTLLVLPGGDVLAVMRGDDDDHALWSARSGDGGRTWSQAVQVTGRRQHPADLTLLSNGNVLLTYGNRTPPYRIEGRISRDGGRSWLDLLLTFSGHLYGYTVEAERPTDLGYPSTAVTRCPGGGQGVTVYYYNPSMRRRPRAEPTDEGRLYPRDDEPFYLARDYYAIAVTWSESELLEAVASRAR